VNPVELAYGAVLVPLLLGLAGYFGWRQIKTLRSLRTNDARPEERGYLRSQAWRRLFCCLLMLVLAGLLAASWLLEGVRLEISDEVRERVSRGQAPTDEQKQFVREFTLFWVSFLGVLFLLLFLVAVDTWAVARFGLRQQRKLREDYRAAIQTDLDRLRGRHNGSP
jgi:hypothetical protein